MMLLLLRCTAQCKPFSHLPANLILHPACLLGQNKHSELVQCIGSTYMPSNGGCQPRLTCCAQRANCEQSTGTK